MDAELRVSSPAAAAVFSSAPLRRVLLGLIEKERSLSELSALTGMPLNLLHHHMRRLLILDLAAVSRVEPRAGRPIRYYRAQARMFFVPAELATGRPGAGLSRRLRDRLEEALTRSIQGYSFSCEDGQPQVRIVKANTGPSTAEELWLELRLSPADAASMTAELRALLDKYRTRSSAAQPVTIVRAALARLA